jgi:CTP synthase (UTP-ammonia lyase)
MRDAEHGEASPKSSRLVISPLSCPLIAETQIVFISPDTLAYEIYRKEKAKEIFNCNYGFNETYHQELNEQDLKIVGVDNNGNARIVELATHRFFMATLFLPQSSSSAEKPHPLIVEYLNAAKVFKFNELPRGKPRGIHE